MASALIVDDHAGVRRGLSRAFQLNHHSTQEAASGEEAIALGLRFRPDVVVVDLVLPRLGGLAAFAALKVENSRTVGIAISGVIPMEDASVLVRAAGAVEFFPKPVDVLKLVRCAETHLARCLSTAEAVPTPMVGRDPAFVRTLDLATLVAPSPVFVLIEGEKGTGKELLAREIHRRSSRLGPFVAINCAAVPLSIVQAELFGTERGAFTEAVSRAGAVERSGGGTLFLDEVGDLDLEAQGILLRVLDQRAVQRLGSTKDISVDLRVVAATNVDLLAAVRSGRFRADLFYRLSQARIYLPPLRARRQDIPVIAAALLRRISAAVGGEGRLLTDEACDRLTSHTWPGNVRELENVLTRAHLVHGSTTIHARDLEFDSSVDQPGSMSVPSLPAGQGLLEAIEDLRIRAERVWIQQALDDSNGSMSRAARRLKVDRKTLYNRLSALGLRSSERCD